MSGRAVEVFITPAELTQALRVYLRVTVFSVHAAGLRMRELMKCKFRYTWEPVVPPFG
jgi:hypothetical protein